MLDITPFKIMLPRARTRRADSARDARATFFIDTPCASADMLPAHITLILLIVTPAVHKMPYVARRYAADADASCC